MLAQSLRLLRVAAALLGVASSSCASQRSGATSALELAYPGAAPMSGATAEAAQLVSAYLARLLREEPERGRALGLHEYDGKVEEVSEEAASAAVRFAREHLAAARALDLAKIEDPVRLDLELTILDAERTLFQLEALALHRRVLSHRGLFDVSGYLTREYAPLAQRVAALLDHVEAATARVDPLLALLDPRQPRTHIETARKVFGGMREYYEGDVATMSAPALSDDPALRERYARVIPAGLASVDRVLAWLDGPGKAQAVEEFALGEERFLRMLEVNEGMKTTLAELEAQAQRDFQRNRDAFIAVAKRIDPTATVEAVVAKVASERIPKDEVINTAQRQLGELLAFIERNDVITIPTSDRATVAVTPPFQRWNSAFLDMAGPFEKVQGSFYYISPPDPSWPKEMQDAYIPYEGDLLATSVHEVYPGHFVHGLHQRRTKTLATKLLESYAFVEGWAHYTEEMMLEAGFGQGDPRLELGQLSNALLRNCRFLAAIGLHTRGMTVDQANELFQKQCFIDPGNAIQQAYRGTFDPGYLSYTMGKLQIMELRAQFFERRKTKSLREFHDWLLAFGAPPIALAARRM